MSTGILVSAQSEVSPKYAKLTGPSAVIGRGSDCDIVLGDKSVSRRHAAIERRPSGHLLIDQHSRNGTRVNGIAVVRRLLRDGDRISFGDVGMEFHEVEDELLPPAAELAARNDEAMEDEDAPASATCAFPSAEFAAGQDWGLVNSWRFIQVFGIPGMPAADEILRLIATDLAGIRDVKKVLIYLSPSTICSSAKWIRPLASGATLGSQMAEETITGVARTGKAVSLVEGKYSDASEGTTVDALCLPVKVAGKTSGCLYAEGNDVLGPGAVQVAHAAADAIGVGLTIWATASSLVPPSARKEQESGGSMIIGRSRALQRSVRMAEKAAANDSTVLLRGETGTGKELFAQLIFQESKRSSGPFVPVHCSAIEETLMGSVLFGHEKGAFTGAMGLKKGVFEEANHGTIFLDEIGELSPAMQVKFLRVLQEGEFMRVGGNRPLRVDVRVIAATNRNLEKAVEDGQFREDLYYRLKVIEVLLPPLRDRPEDMADLVNHFIVEIGAKTATSIKTVSPEAMALLQKYDWPGNVRELRNVIERCLVLAEGEILTVDDLPTEIASICTPIETPSSKTETPTGGLDLDAAQTRHIDRVLKECHGNKRLAARRLGISRSTLYEKLKQMGKGE